MPRELSNSKREEKLVDFLQQISRLETESEINERTDDEGMSGDDACETVSSLIDGARGLLMDLGYVPQMPDIASDEEE